MDLQKRSAAGNYARIRGFSGEIDACSQTHQASSNVLRSYGKMYRRSDKYCIAVRISPNDKGGDNT